MDKGLFRETDEKFTYWFANGHGISHSLVGKVYENMDVEKAKEVRDELNDIIELYEEYQNE